MQIPFHFQLVSKQVDLLGDGILGWDFLKQMQVQISYLTKTLTVTYEVATVIKSLSNQSPRSEVVNPEIKEGRVRLLPRSETIVRLPVEEGFMSTEGLIDNRELLPGVY